MTQASILKVLKTLKKIFPRNPKGWVVVAVALLTLSIFVVETYDPAPPQSQGSVIEYTTNPDQLYSVVKVADGDTITIMVGDTHVPVRLIGVDTPESVDPRRPVQCYGQEASSFTTARLQDAQVYVESDPTQGEMDKYNRLLRYVRLQNGTDFNAVLIREGYAFEYTFKTPYQRQSQYQELEQQARQQQSGLWHAESCNGQR